MKKIKNREENNPDAQDCLAKKELIKTDLNFTLNLSLSSVVSNYLIFDVGEETMKGFFRNHFFYVRAHSLSHNIV